MDCVLGVDAGTTSVSVVLAEAASGRIVDARSRKHAADLKSKRAGEALQDPARILGTVSELLVELKGETEAISDSRSAPVAIGVTGQMHGVLYLDGEGRAISPLFTWLDQRGEWGTDDGRTYRERMREEIGAAPPAGYGAVTHFVNSVRGEVPAGARGICTLPDWIAMQLAGGRQPVTDAGLAQSVGLFDVEAGRFREELWRRIDNGAVALPRVAPAGARLPQSRPEEPVVCVPTGDNQASFLGAVGRGESSLLLNVGTSAQVVYRVAGPEVAKLAARVEGAGNPAIELRALGPEEWITVGASLSGGKVFELLGGLLRELGEESGAAVDVDRVLARDWRKPPEPGLRVDTRIAGARDEPEATGAITGITMSNFTVPHLVWGVAEGVARELRLLWEQAIGVTGTERFRPTGLVGGGNAIRRSPTLRRALEERFGLPLSLSSHPEEAACGAALLARRETSSGVVD